MLDLIDFVHVDDELSRDSKFNMPRQGVRKGTHHLSK